MPVHLNKPLCHSLWRVSEKNTLGNVILFCMIIMSQLVMFRPSAPRPLAASYYLPSSSSSILSSLSSPSSLPPHYPPSSVRGAWCRSPPPSSPPHTNPSLSQPPLPQASYHPTRLPQPLTPPHPSLPSCCLPSHVIMLITSVMDQLRRLSSHNALRQ